MDIVEVYWVDSTGRSDWHDPADALNLLDRIHCRSVGYLVVDKPEGIVIIQGTGNLGQYLASMAIPRQQILGISHLATGPDLPGQPERRPESSIGP